MNISWKTIIWQQFGAAIDMLDNALRACPDELWRDRLWDDPPSDQRIPSSGFSFIIPYTGSTLTCPAQRKVLHPQTALSEMRRIQMVDFPKHLIRKMSSRPI
jgi:hypothetical protein